MCVFNKLNHESVRLTCHLYNVAAFIFITKQNSLKYARKITLKLCFRFMLFWQFNFSLRQEWLLCSTTMMRFWKHWDLAVLLVWPLCGHAISYLWSLIFVSFALAVTSRTVHRSKINPDQIWTVIMTLQFWFKGALTLVGIVWGFNLYIVIYEPNKRKYPLNIIFLALLTIAMSLMTGKSLISH